MAVEFSPSLRGFIEVWVGANVATGNEDDGYRSRYAYDKLADDVRALSDAMDGAISQVGSSLPPEIGKQFIGAMKLFVDDAGENHLYNFADQLSELSSTQAGRSMKLQEGKFEIILEFIFMNLEIALILAFSVFTGGTSLTEIALARSRTALSMIMIMQRMGRAVGTPMAVAFEAIQEAFVAFGAQIMTMTMPTDPGRRRGGFDWSAVGDAALFGAFAGLFGDLIGGVTSTATKGLLKGQPKAVKEVADLPASFINEGGAEVFAEATVNAIKGTGAGSA